MEEATFTSGVVVTSPEEGTMIDSHFWVDPIISKIEKKWNTVVVPYRSRNLTDDNLQECIIVG